jgi:transcriptional regulator with GAF, ATPase, and Fis domain
MIEAALVEANGNTSLAARQLGITRMALRYRAEKHGLQPDDYRGRRQG